MKIAVFAFLLLGRLYAGAQQPDVQSYHFEVDLFDRTDSIYGYAVINLTPSQGVKTVSFNLKSSDGNSGMTVSEVRDVRNLPRAYVHRDDTVIVSLNEAEVAGEGAAFRIRYSGVCSDGLIISKNKYGDRTFFADNWPNRAQHWLPCIDRPDDKAAVEFLVRAPEGYSVVSNGVKIQESITDRGRKLTLWRNNQNLPTKVMVIGVAKFATKTFDDSPPGIPVSAWVYPQDSTKGFYDYALAPSILNFFSNYIGPYPYQKLANVQSKTIFGGMENASAIFYAEGSVTGDRSSEDLLAHEIAHQWFGDAASEKSFAHLWLSEGFATYLTNVYLESKYGKERLQERMKKNREDVIEFARTSAKPVVDSAKNLMSLLNANSYQKGGWVLHMLRQEVGDSVFRKIIQAYYDQYKGGNADSRDFEAVAESVSGKELTPFFDQWLYRPGIPKLKIEQTKDGATTRLKVVQTGELYQIPLTVKISVKGKPAVTEKIKLTGHETLLAWKGKAATNVEFVLDPDTELLFEEVK